jgi:hypothetical protein
MVDVDREGDCLGDSLVVGEGGVVIERVIVGRDNDDAVRAD